ncbi:hypothetical protein NQ317_019123 [Molorchus minor]|uniref:Reverse transcriptase domain-containing protein n=1 Tax=Molorchus minor TaxID=1323400 RepID=A0ABQ9J0X8_9CUCU|nr:hypothetical protein NQ317_019123 [Molorchus minor]
MRLMPRVGGPSSSKRLLLYNVVASTMLYGAEVWHSSLRIKAYKALMDKTQRKALLGVAGAYRTTSTEALQVLHAQGRSVGRTRDRERKGPD